MFDLGLVITLIKKYAPGVSPAAIEQAVTDWLDAHPEATTTVEDGSITEEKLAQDVLAQLGQISTLSDFIYPTSEQRKKMNIVNRDMSLADKSRVKKNKKQFSDIIAGLGAGKLYLEDFDPKDVEQMRNLLGLGNKQ